MRDAHRTTRSAVARRLRALVLPALALVAWELVSRLGPSYAYAFVPLADIARSAWQLLASGEIARNALASIGTALQGLGIGTAAGLFVALAMAWSRPVDALLNPLIQALRQVPNLALLPLIVLWFGNGQATRTLVVSLAVFEVMALNAYEGLHRVDKRFLEVAQALTLSRWQTFRRILLPSALPSIAIGLQHAVAFAWLSTIGVELLFAIGPGIAGVMERSQAGARMDAVLVCLAVVALLGHAMQLACRQLTRHLLRWQSAAYGR